MTINLGKFFSGFALCVVLAVSVAPTVVLAQTPPPVTQPQAQAMVSNSGKLSNAISNFTRNISQAPTLFNVMAYACGVFFMAMGLSKANQSVQDPSRTPMSEAIKRLGAGVALASLPSVTGILKGSFAISGSNLAMNYATGLAGASSNMGAQGLDMFMVNMVTDILGPIMAGVSVLTYAAGLFLLFSGLQRLTKGAQEGPKGPAGLGTLMNFAVGSALMSFSPFLQMTLNSVFGTNRVTTYPNMSNIATQIGVDSAQMAQTTAVITALLAFLSIVGVISFARGLFMLKDTADGAQNASLMGSMSHLVAGVCCVNFGAFANMLQTTLNLQQYGIVFQVQ